MESEMEAGSMRMVSRGPSNYHRVLTYDIYTYIYIYKVPPPRNPRLDGNSGQRSRN